MVRAGRTGGQRPARLLRLTVYDTHELRMELLSYGPEVQVLAPVRLRDWLRSTHLAAVPAH